MSKNFLGPIIHLGLLGVMALPLLARSCDTVATTARVGDTATSTISQASRASRFDDSQLAFRAGESDGTTLFRELAIEAPRLSENLATSYLRGVEPTIRFATALPDHSTEFISIFGREPTLAMLDETTTVNRNFNTFEDAAQSAKSADEIARVISGSDENVIAVIAHNDNGRLIFPDGSQLEIAEMANMCAAADKRCVVLSCESSDFIADNSASISGVSRVITTQEALFISRRLSGYLKRLRTQDKQISYRDLDLGIRYVAANSEAMALTIGQAKRASKVVAAGSTVGAIVFFGDDE
ncbi:hypothetical protein [uncultured Tateyamaria sp.]|uniref:hypothetical protein n=1 Tax=uncultured Tateyamaria sp. TaxID=455651 RepID=UPI0026043E45|nr:hypothetical protein [uncultured Tateyamaria sp.]